MRSRVAIVGMLAALVACTRPARPPAEAESAAAVQEAQEPPTRGGPRAPFVLEVEAPSRASAGEEVAITALVELPAPAPAPIHLSIESSDDVAVPLGDPGVELQAGLAGTVVHRWQVRVIDPAGPVVVVARLQAEGMGAIARRELTFDGSVEPPAPARGPGAIVRPLGSAATGDD